MRVEREVRAPTSGSRSEGKRIGPNTSQGGPSQSQSAKNRGRFRCYSGKRLGRGAASSSQGSVRSPVGPSGSRDTQSIVPECSTCGKRHSGVCRWNTAWGTACFHCGQEGHFIRECPQLIITEESETIPSAPTQTSGSQGSAGRSSQPCGPGSSGSSRGPRGRGYRGRGRGTPSAHPDRSLTQARVFAVTQ